MYHSSPSQLIADAALTLPLNMASWLNYRMHY